MDYLEKAGRVLDLEIFELQRLRKRLDENFSRAVDLIKGAVEARGKVIVLGVGKSGYIGEKIAATLTSTGSPAVVLDSGNALHGDLGMIADGDIILALSFSGETDELIRIPPAIARFQVKIIAFCGDVTSTLDGVDVIGEGQDVLGESLVVLERDFNRVAVDLAFDVVRISRVGDRRWTDTESERGANCGADSRARNVVRRRGT